LPRVGRWIDVRYALTAAGLACASVVLGVLASEHDTFPGDRAVNATVRELGGAFEPVAYTFNELDGLIAVGVVAMVGGGLLMQRRLGGVTLVAAAVALRPVLNLLKPLVDRPRPTGDFAVLDVVYDSSFPSGHTMTAVTVFALLFVFAGELVPRRVAHAARVAAVAGIVLMATSRMWAGVHWFSDTWGAVVWGLAMVFAVLALQPACGELERWMGVGRRPAADEAG
jgi:membrane-associated phospholipid phosphatase